MTDRLRRWLFCRDTDNQIAVAGVPELEDSDPEDEAK
jgi:hypothetical protein